MSLLFVEGFDAATTVTGSGGETATERYILDKYPAVVVNGRVFTGWGNLGVAFTHGTTASAESGSHSLDFASPEGTIYFGFAFKPANVLDTNDFISLINSTDGVTHITFELLGNTRIRVYRGTQSGTVLTTTDPVIHPDRWFHLQAKVTISNTVGIIEIKINGITVVSLSGLDTRNGGTTDTITRFTVRGIAASGSAIEDVYLIDDVWVDDAQYHGMKKVEHIAVNAAGDTTDWTPSAGSNFQNVDETPKDGDTTYNESSTTNNIDLFNMASLVNITSSISGIQVNVDSRVTVSAINLRTKIKSGATTANGASKSISDTTNYQTVYEVSETDPNTAAAWLVAGINAVQTGYENLG